MDDERRGDKDLDDALRFALAIVERHATVVDGLAKNAAKSGFLRSEGEFSDLAQKIRGQAVLIRVPHTVAGRRSHQAELMQSPNVEQVPWQRLPPLRSAPQARTHASTAARCPAAASPPISAITRDNPCPASCRDR